MFRLVQLVMLLAAVFVIIGLESTSRDSPTTVSPWNYAGAIAYIAAYVLVAYIYVKMLPYGRSLPTDEKFLVPAIGAALPFVLVRLAYSVLSTFVHSGVFAKIGGSVVVHVCMALLEELVVVALYLGLAFRLNALEESEQGPIQQRPWKARQGRRARRRQERYGYEAQNGG